MVVAVSRHCPFVCVMLSLSIFCAVDDDVGLLPSVSVFLFFEAFFFLWQYLRSIQLCFCDFLRGIENDHFFALSCVLSCVD